MTTTRALTLTHLPSQDARLHEVSALCLLLGLVRAIDAMPRDALEGMLEAMTATEDGRATQI